MKQSIDLGIKEFLDEKDRKRVHHLDLEVPAQDLHLWIMDAYLLLIKNEHTERNVVIYISVNSRSKQGVRLIRTAEMLNTFKEYEKQDVNRRFIRYKIVNPNYNELVGEISRILIELFPKLNLSDLNVTVERRDNWITLQD
jgi:hypothetical protein